MEINVIKEDKNALFGRREVELEIKSDSTPSKADALKEVATKLGVAEDSVVIKVINGKFGSQVFDTVAFVYDSTELKEKVEPKKKEKKK